MDKLNTIIDTIAECKDEWELEIELLTERTDLGDRELKNLLLRWESTICTAVGIDSLWFTGTACYPRLAWD